MADLSADIKYLLRGVSEHGGEFRESDVGDGPNRRFLVGAVGENCSLVAVEHGGIGYYVELHIFVPNGGGWSDIEELHGLRFPMSFPEFIANSQFVIGQTYLKNEEGEQVNQAIKWYELSAENHFAPAEYALGEIYMNGHGVQKDTTVAAKWFDRAVAQAPKKFAFELGQIYEKGVSLPKNDAKAASLYRSAANEENELAQQRLGQAFENGELGLEKDNAEALHWYRLAATHPITSANVPLGAMYWEGRGVKKNPIVALALLGLPTAAGGSGNAMRKSYEKLMTSGERKVAEALCEQMYKDMFWNGPDHNLILSLDRYLANPKMPPAVPEKDRRCLFGGR